MRDESRDCPLRPPRWEVRRLRSHRYPSTALLKESQEHVDLGKGAQLVSRAGDILPEHAGPILLAAAFARLPKLAIPAEIDERPFERKVPGDLDRPVEAVMTREELAEMKEW